jgi:hypothetical protein
MKTFVRPLAIACTGSLLAFSGVASAQRPAHTPETPQVTWKAAPGHIVDSTSSAGAQVAKDADGRIRPVRAGELPEEPIGRATQIIDYPGGARLAIAGDDLMTHAVAVAVKKADGSVSVRVGHSTDAQTQLEVK